MNSPCLKNWLRPSQMCANERLALLGIPAFVDRSADEETEEGRLEWIKVYGMILGCEEEANALYEMLASELSEEQIAA